ncbi:MAG: glycine--tRNA ligase subunit beta [Holosporales bacterium]|jgi:glycyl-tRNA synthetase beta chain|nr:glycine--tRNA ligase subunit beta [Holosporales bacterium]
MTQTFFFEIYSEEIPARMQKMVVPHAKEVIEQVLSYVGHGEVLVYCAPRRLCVCAKNVDESTQPSVCQKRGPRTDAPAAAIEGFLRANNLKRADLVESNGYFYATVESSAFAFVETIPNVINSFIRAVPWPKSMHWTISDAGSSLRHSRPWVRPVRSLLCLWGNECVPCVIEDWGITASNITYVASQAKSASNATGTTTPISVHSFEHYLELLNENFVIVDYDARQRAIIYACQQALKGKGLEIVPDQALLDEVTGLVDYPFVVVGRIEDKFMHLPTDVLRTSMRVHQKYFATKPIGDKTDALAPYFVAISNRPENETTLRGFENVLLARLSDALFFYNEDLKVPLENNLPKLDHIIFHEKLGTLGQKVRRLRRLVPEMDRSAMLCKLDLVSNMVNEFNELQGIMGAHYAMVQGEPKEVVDAILGHYKGHGDGLPDGGAKLAIADKLDTLVGFLSVGIKPTGSKDPYALRRAALGIIRISINCLQLDLDTMAWAAISGYSDVLSVDADDVFQSLKTFIYERLAVYMKDQEAIRYDIVQSVLDSSHLKCREQNPSASKDERLPNPNLSHGSPIDDATNRERALNIRDLYVRAQSIQRYFETECGDFMQLFTRVNGLISDNNAGNVDPSLFESPTEAHAYSEVLRLCENHSQPSNEYDYIAPMRNIAELKPAIYSMLDAVHVNCDDPVLNKNRQALLGRVMRLYQEVADFSKIEVI